LENAQGIDQGRRPGEARRGDADLFDLEQGGLNKVV
jgi:hypothetical protein